MVLCSEGVYINQIMLKIAGQSDKWFQSYGRWKIRNMAKMFLYVITFTLKTFFVFKVTTDTNNHKSFMTKHICKITSIFIR